MTIRPVTKLQSLSSAPAINSTASLNVPVGPTYNAFIIRCAQGSGGAASTVAEMKAAIDTIKVRLNGDVIQEFTATELLELQDFYTTNIGFPATDGVIPVFFSLPWVRKGDGEALALGTANVSSLSLEIKYKGAITNVGHVEVYAETSAPRNLTNYLERKRHGQNFSGTGIKEISDIPRGNKNILLAMHIKEGSGTIDDVEVRTDNAVFLEQDVEVATALLKRGGRTIQGGYFHVDLLRTNQVSAALDIGSLQDFRQKINFSTSPDAFDVLTEMIVPFTN